MSSGCKWKWSKSTSFTSLMEWWVSCLDQLQMNLFFLSKLEPLNSHWDFSVSECSICCEKSSHLRYFTQVTLKWEYMLSLDLKKKKGGRGIFPHIDLFVEYAIAVVTLQSCINFFSNFSPDFFKIILIVKSLKCKFVFCFFLNKGVQNIFSHSSLVFLLSCFAVVPVGTEPGSDQWPSSSAGGGTKGEAGCSGEGQSWPLALCRPLVSQF